MRELKILLITGFYLLVFPAYASQTLTCVSENNAFQRCPLSSADQRDIRIKSLKSGNCDLDNSWGVDSSGVWVSKGCGAVFEYSANASSSDQDNQDSGVYIAPEFAVPFYGPGFYYGAGYYDSNGWDDNDYCHNGDCHRNQNHDNDDEHRGGGSHGGGGGFHGGGGRR